MADRVALFLNATADLEQIANDDNILAGGLKRTGGTITVDATTLALGATNMTLAGGGNVTGSSGSTLSGFDSIEGIASGDLLDKTADETVTGTYTFQKAGDTTKLIVKASGSEAETALLDIQDSGGSSLWSVDEDGDMTVQGSEVIVGTSTFQGNTTFGDATTDTVTFTARMATGTDLIPQSDGGSDLGTSALRYGVGFFDRIDCPLYTETQAANETAGTAVSFLAGDGGDSGGTGAGGAGGAASYAAGTGGDGDATNAAGAGGATTISGGAAGADGGGGGASGGAMNVLGGAATGAGTDGAVNIGTSDTSAINVGAASIATAVTGTLSVTLDDNTSDALDIQEGTNNYLNINTTNTSEEIQFGNATTNPAFSFLGSGGVTVNAGGLTVTAGGATITAGGLTVTAGGITSTGTHTFNLTDNTANVFDVQQGSDEYISIDTTDASEAITFGNATTNPTYSFAGSGGVTVDDGGLTVTAGGATITAGGLTVTAGGITSTGTHTFNLTDNTANVFDVQQGSDEYISIDTTDSSELITFGNATTNPDVTFAGTGAIVAANGTLDIPDGTDLLIAGVALTTANFTAANLDTLLDGSNADALHTHSGLATSSGWTTTGLAAGDVAYADGATGDKTAGKAIADGTTAGTEIVVGVVDSAGVLSVTGEVNVTIADASAPTAGDRLYLSEATAGQLTTTPPSGSGEFVAPVAVAIDASGHAGAGTQIDAVLQVQKPTKLA